MLTRRKLIYQAKKIGNTSLGGHVPILCYAKETKKK